MLHGTVSPHPTREYIPPMENVLWKMSRPHTNSHVVGPFSIGTGISKIVDLVRPRGLAVVHHTVLLSIHAQDYKVRRGSAGNRSPLELRQRFLPGLPVRRELQLKLLKQLKRVRLEKRRMLR